MYVNTVGACAVEIAWQGTKRAFEVRRAAGYVVPRIANLVSVRRIKRQRIPVAIQITAQRHSRIYSVVERALDHVRIFSVARCRQHSPAPHHVPDRRAAFTVRLRVRQFVRVSERLAIAPRAHAARDVHLRGNQIFPKRIQRLPVRFVARFQVVVRRTAARVHCAHRVSFQFRPRSERLPAKVIHIILRLQRNPRISSQQIFRKIQMPLVAGHPVQLDQRQFHLRMPGHQRLFTRFWSIRRNQKLVHKTNSRIQQRAVACRAIIRSRTLQKVAYAIKFMAPLLRPRRHTIRGALANVVGV